MKPSEQKTEPEASASFQPSSRVFWVLFSLITGFGIFLRIYQLSGQILLDDEWHALHFAINHSLGYILTHFSYAGANIIPINAYARLLLTSTGWSELLLVLPSLMAGIAALAVFPLIVRRWFGNRASLFFAFLLAVSPLLIFYTRVCRPYAVYTFFGCLCVWLLFEWARSGKRRHGVFFGICSVCCIYFHFVGVIFVFVPLGWAALLKIVGKAFRISQITASIRPSLKELMFSGLGIIFCLALILGPALIQRLPSMPLAPAQFTLASVAGFLKILSGTANLPLNLLFYGFCIAGAVRLFRSSFFHGGVLINIFLAYIMVSLITRSNFAHVPLVLARYIIPAFPLAFVLAALGLNSLWKTGPRLLPGNRRIMTCLLSAFTAAFLFCLVWSGPLRQTYGHVNNFTSHSAFQESYAPIDWDQPRISEMIQRPYAINKKNMSDFYKTLTFRSDINKIIEFPMCLSNHFNPFYYYQRFHRKRVAVGYTRAIKDTPDMPASYVTGDMIVDQILSQADAPEKPKFQNLVNILDMAAVKASRADVVVLHKNIFFEMFGPQKIAESGEIPLTAGVIKAYRRIFGPPVFEDRCLAVFQIKK